MVRYYYRLAAREDPKHIPMGLLATNMIKNGTLRGMPMDAIKKLKRFTDEYRNPIVHPGGVLKPIANDLTLVPETTQQNAIVILTICADICKQLTNDLIKLSNNPVTFLDARNLWSKYPGIQREIRRELGSISDEDVYTISQDNINEIKERKNQMSGGAHESFLVFPRMKAFRTNSKTVLQVSNQGASLRCWDLAWRFLGFTMRTTIPLSA